MKCVDLSEVKMIVKQNIISKNFGIVFTFKEHRQLFMIFSTRGYDVREILTRKLMIR